MDMVPPMRGEMLRPFGAVAARQSLVLALELAQEIRFALRGIRGNLPSVVRSAGGTRVLPSEMLLQAGLDGRAFAARVAVIDKLVLLPQRINARIVGRTGNHDGSKCVAGACDRHFFPANELTRRLRDALSGVSLVELSPTLSPSRHSERVCVLLDASHADQTQRSAVRNQGAD